MPRAERNDAVVRDWQISVIPSLAGGLNTSDPVDLIDDEEVPTVNNFTFRDGRVRVDTGYRKLGGVIRGTPKAGFQHQTAAGVVETLLITSATVYKYIVAVTQWQYIPDAILTAAGHTKLNGAHVTGNTTLNVDSSTGLLAGEYIAVELDDGTQLQTTVATVPGGVSITIPAPGLPSNAADDKHVFQAVQLTGTDDEQVVILGIPATEWTVFTNNTNKPKRYDGTTVIDIPGLPAALTRCKTLSLFKNHLVLGNLVESGVSKPEWLRWNADGNFSDWTTGDAGAVALADTRDPITALAPLADRLIIYRTRSIAQAEHVGLPLEPFAFTQVIFGESIGGKGLGAVSPNAVYPQHDRHFVLSIDGVYQYNGGLQFVPVSDKIKRGIFGVSGEVDPNKLHRAFIHYADGIDELMVFYMATTDAGTYPKRAVCLDLLRGTWRKRTFTHQLAFMGTRTAGETLRIIDLVGAILEQAWIIGSGVSQSGQPEMLMGGPNLQPWLYDFVSPDDDGTDIQFDIRTKVFRGSDRSRRYDFFEFHYYGPAADVYAFPHGLTAGIYKKIGKFAATASFRRYRIYYPFTAEELQLYITGIGGGAELGRIVMKHKEGSRWEMYAGTTIY